MNNLHELIANEHTNICEIVAFKKGKQAYEDYWHGFKAEDSLNVMSVTKSVMSLLIGIAIDMGHIKGVNQKVLDFFPDYTPKRGEKTIHDITLHHILTMTAPYKYKSEPWTKICSSDDWTKAALDILGGKSGITGEFKYSTLGIQILSGVIANASGMATLDYANKYLFAPLDIAPRSGIELETAEVHKEFVLSKKPKKKTWVVDSQNSPTAGWGLCLSAREMAKIGQLCLGQGMYNNNRIMQADWINAMTSAYYRCDERFANMSYGYLWWIVNEKNHIYAAIGDGGNVIYVNPDKNTVVAVASTFKPRVYDRIQLIQEQIEPLL